MPEPIRVEWQTDISSTLESTRKVAEAQAAANKTLEDQGDKARAAVGPMQALERAQKALAKVGADATEAQRFDAAYRVQQAQKRLDFAMGIRPETPPKPPKTPKPPPSFADKLELFARSTRFGAGDASPLLGPSLDLLGMGAMAGPTLIAAAGVMALGQASTKAAEYLNNLAATRWAAGTTPGGAMRLENIGAAVGVSGAQVASDARSMAQQISTDNWARFYGLKAGLGYEYANPMLSTLDRSKKFIQAIEFMTNASEEQALRMARAIPALEPYLALRDLSPERLQKALKAMEEANSQEAIRSAADFRAAIGDVTLGMQRLAISLTPVLDAFVYLSQVGGGVNMSKKMMGAMQVLPTSWSAIKVFPNVWKALFPDKKAEEDKKTSATKRNTDAIDALTAEMGNMRRLYGGGNRAANAIPGKWGRETLNDPSVRDSINLGAFSL